MANEISELLLTGSQNIDLMRKEIDRLVSMFSGIIRSRTPWLRVGVLVLDSRYGRPTECLWVVKAQIGNTRPDMDFFRVECFVGGRLVYEFPKTGTQPSFSPESVVTVWENVDLLTSGLRGEDIPGFNEGLRPFFRAAMFFKSE